MPPALMWPPEIGAPDSRHVKLAPREALVPALAFTSSSGPTPSVFTAKRQRRVHAAELGLATVRAHSQAMTVASEPSGSRALG